MILLIHGGLQGAMDAERFWRTPGIVAGLEAAGHEVVAPDRLADAESWSDEAKWLLEFVSTSAPVTTVAGSNGCSVALRLAIDHPWAVSKLILCWPATPTDQEGSQSVRGVTDAELSRLAVPVVLIPSEPPSIHHQPRTVSALSRLIANVSIVTGSPESPSPLFAAQRAAFLETLLTNL